MTTTGGTTSETTPLNAGFQGETTAKPPPRRLSVLSEKEKILWKQGKGTTPSDLARITRRQTGQDLEDGPCTRFSKDVPTRNEFEFYSPGIGPESPYPNETDCIKTIEGERQVIFCLWKRWSTNKVNLSENNAFVFFPPDSTTGLPPSSRFQRRISFGAVWGLPFRLFRNTRRSSRVF